MIENCCPERQLGDSERRHTKVRELLIDALSFAMTVWAVFHYKPEGTLAGIILAAGAYVVAKLLVAFVWAISGVLLAWLSVLIRGGGPLCKVAGPSFAISRGRLGRMYWIIGGRTKYLWFAV
jgi:hypothetical protein